MTEDVARIPEEPGEDVLTLLDASRFTHLSDLRGLREEALLRLQRESFRRALARPDTIALVRRKRTRPAGFVVFGKLDFDTELFGFPCYALQNFVVATHDDLVSRRRLLREALDRLQEQGAVFVSARAHALEATTIAELQAARFEYMDTTMRYAYDLRATPPPEFQPPVSLRESRPGDQDVLVDIAATYSDNRFHYDRRIPRERADEMYRAWLRNSFRGDADWIVVAEVDGTPVGFTTNKDHPELVTETGGSVGEMVFSAVSPAARGKDVYTSMIHAGLVHFHGRADLVYLGCLASNVAVQRAWQRLGFRVTSVACSFHRWLNEPSFRAEPQATPDSSIRVG